MRANRTLPPVTAPASTFSLPEAATTAALSQARLFPEPLALVGPAAPDAADNRALAAAMREFAASGDLGPLDAFVKAHPASPWLPSLMTNLGLLKFDAGYFSDALALWSQAWALGKDSATPEAEAIVVRALAEAVKMNCRLGRVADAKSLLTGLGDRPTAGLNASMLDQSRKAIVQMETMPDDCFKCGPYALSSILAHTRQHTPGTMKCLTAYPTTAQGTSLAQVAELANTELGMKMQPARRLSAGAPLILPAVVNWKLNHYGALLEKKDNRYLLADPTFGTSQWVGEDAIVKESSGYFLVPAGPLPSGWAAVDNAEAGTVWGRGDCAVGDPDGTGPNSPKVPKGCGGRGRGMAVWSIHHSLASLNIEDIPLAYDPPVGPAVEFRVNYSQLEQNQPTTFNYSNIGPLWNLSWVSFLTFDSANARLRSGEGGTELYTNFNASTNTYDPDQSSGTKLFKISATNYERRSPDGSKLVFSLPDGSGRIFLTQIVDPQGNALTMTYDANYRLTAATDAAGQVSVLTHGSNTVGNALFYKVTKVTDPFGRFTTLAYNASGRLISVTDQIGITSSFTYGGAANVVSSLTTPYGATAFDCGFSNNTPSGALSYVQVTEPNGGKQRVESCQYSTTPASDTAVPSGMPLLNQYLNYRNSYYWDAKAMLDAPGDYTKARLTHFLHLNVSSIKAAVIESEKNALESRVWYYYQNQSQVIFSNQGMGSNPTHVARLLDDGSTQLDRFSYNTLGNLTQSIDPLGRTTNYTYAADSIDLLKVEQINAQGGSDQLAAFTWNAQRRPLTITDTAGGITTLAYNARGQATSITNARNDTTSYAYNAQGYLLSVDGPLPGTGDTLTFTYDAFGRVRTATNGDGYTLTADYDALDRLTKVTYPDGTFEQITYSRLDATQTRDRLGRLTNYTYNAIRQLTSVTDPLNRATSLEWCSCGALKKLIDPLGRATAWDQDIQGRPISKTYADGTTETYTYEKTNGRLASATDAKGQIKEFSYNTDNTVAGILYIGAQQKTPAVSLLYDPAYPRLVSMTDGLGLTTFTYGTVTGGVSPGANQLTEVNTPWNSTKVTYSYDPLGRVLSRSINGVSQTFTRDAGGRLSAVTNALGTFNYTFENSSGRVTGAALPNGQTVAAAYFANTGDRRLRQIKNLNANGSTLSQFDHTYNASGQILTWAQQAGANPAANYSLTYDAASQLTAMAATGKSYGYSYDKADNRLTRTLNAATTSFAYDVLNGLQNASPALGSDKTYLWDAEDRLVGINYSGSNLNTRLTYDGLGRCVEIVENNSTTPTSIKRFVWCGFERCEERDASGNVTRRFFPQGEQVSGASYFYSFDHLGSMREMTDMSGALRARYEYDPYGVRTRLAGDLEASAGYTGHYHHAPSGLHLTRFRAYDATTGRWLSRDPLGTLAGTNLYAYVSNNPSNFTDPLGLIDAWAAGVATANLAGNSVAVVGGGALAAAGTAATVTIPFVGQAAGPLVAVAGAGIAARGAYGAVANAANLGAALADQPSLSQGSVLGDAIERKFPGNNKARAAGAVADVALDLATGNLGSSAKLLGAPAKVDNALSGLGATTAAGGIYRDNAGPSGAATKTKNTPPAKPARGELPAGYCPR